MSECDGCYALQAEIDFLKKEVKKLRLVVAEAGLTDETPEDIEQDESDAENAAWERLMGDDL